MAEDFNLKSPVAFDADSRVAYDLMHLVSGHEYSDESNHQKNRDYWFRLYHQCWRLVKFGDLDEGIGAP
jgi:hypothetical protein